MSETWCILQVDEANPNRATVIAVHTSETNAGLAIDSDDHTLAEWDGAELPTPGMKVAYFEEHDLCSPLPGTGN